MRRGEAFKLKWKEVDFASGIITVIASNSKTDRPRLIPMLPRLKETLLRYYEASNPSPDSLVFGITTTIKAAWKTILKEAGLTNLRLHDLRHHATTEMVQAGIHHSEIMKVTGHTQMTTFQRYNNPDSQRLNEISNQLHEHKENKRRKLMEETESSPFIN